MLRTLTVTCLWALGVLLAPATSALAAPIALPEGPIRVRETDLAPSDQLFEINVDGSGHLVVSDYGAGQIWRIDPTTGAYTRYSVGSDFGSRVVDARQDGSVWWTDFGTALFQMDPTTGGVRVWDEPLDSQQWGDLSGLAFDGAGHLWISRQVGGGIFRFDPDTGQRCRFLPADNGGNSYYVTLAGGAVWFIDWILDRVYRLDPGSGQLTRWPLPGSGSEAVGFALDATESLWWADRGAAGIGRLQPGTNALTLYTPPSGTPLTLALHNDLVWYAGGAAGVVGILDPAVAVGVTTAVTPTLETLSPTCDSLTLAGTYTATLHSGILSWDDYGLQDGSGGNGWAVYSLSAGTDTYGVVGQGDYVWLTDKGRRKLVRIHDGNAPLSEQLSLQARADRSSVTHGTAITYTYVVSYTSSDHSPAQNVQVKGDGCSGTTFVGGDGDGDGRLDVGERWTYTCTAVAPPHDDNESPILSNPVAASGQNIVGEALTEKQATVAVIVEHMAGTLTVEATPVDVTTEHGAGAAFTYTVGYAVADAASATDVQLVDTLCGSRSLMGGDTDGDGRLDVNEQWRYDCAYVIPDHMPGEPNPITNWITATADSFDGVPIAPRSTSTALKIFHDSQFTVTATVDPVSVQHGAALTYAYTVTYSNLDNLPATTVEVRDERCPGVSFVGGDVNDNDQMEPGETWRYRCLYDVPAHMADESSTITNRVAVSGRNSRGDIGGDGALTTASLVHMMGALNLQSTPSVTEVAPGATLTYTHRLSYASDDGAPAREPAVTDSLCGSLAAQQGDTNGNGLLDVSEAWLYRCSYGVGAAAMDPLVNQVSGTGQNFDGVALAPQTTSTSVKVNLTGQEGQSIFLPLLLR